MPMPSTLSAGRDEPMGSHVRDGGVNFALWSDHATRVELCLFDAAGTQELRRFDLHGPRDGVWCGFLPGAGAGLVYGYRVHGPYEPDHGHRFNHHKLLLDPNAREIVGRQGVWPEHLGETAEGAMDIRDDAAVALKARVVPTTDRRGRINGHPRHDASQLVLYEVHVKGFTRRHPDIPPELRGTFLGLSHPAAIAHYRRVGVNALSLLPVQMKLDEGFLAERGLSNYWGYNTLGFFAADPRFATRADSPSVANDEFRRMVSELHEAGIAVILDVVYNHTPEGNERGPTLAQRGLDNASWYALAPWNRRHYENHTGCGNTVNVFHPRVTQFVLDSLRYWVDEMGVDGFRFDLAPVLGRGPDGYDPQAPFFAALAQDPVLARAYLIAEPWDAGAGGYQLGHFPGRFMEWNDKFRDAVRRYWLHRGIDRGAFARRFFASNDVFHHRRRPGASINFVAVHDGFTLADLVSYAHKHNDMNGEGNRDGRDGEPSANFGVEGPTSDAGVRRVRRRVQRALLATTVLAQGTPMLGHGDELGRTQHGNNNGWCQDNATSWIDWGRADEGLIDFTARVLALRAREPALAHDAWFERDRGLWRLHWSLPSGKDLDVHDWHSADEHALACVFLQAPSRDAPPAEVAPRLVIAFNPHDAPRRFALPAGRWRVVLDSSALDDDGDDAQLAERAGAVDVPGHALLVLKHDDGGAPSVNEPGRLHRP